MKPTLEKVIKEKVKPIIDDATLKHLGITSPEIEVDISQKLLKNPLLDIPIDITISFKKAKLLFKRFYLQRLLKLHFGNVSEVARIAGIDRRSIHRLTARLKVDVPKMRKEMEKADYIKQSNIATILETSLESYKSSFNPKKMKELYEYVPTLSKEIMRELPDAPVTLKEAEAEFEKRFLVKALEESKGNKSKAARQTGLRFETLHRKLKSFGLS